MTIATEGRINVKLEMQVDGSVRGMMTVERSDTFNAVIDGVDFSGGEPVLLVGDRRVQSVRSI